jgi:hypothetical protein
MLIHVPMSAVATTITLFLRIIASPFVLISSFLARHAMLMTAGKERYPMNSKQVKCQYVSKMQPNARRRPLPDPFKQECLQQPQLMPFFQASPFIQSGGGRPHVVQTRSHSWIRRVRNPI